MKSLKEYKYINNMSMYGIDYDYNIVNKEFIKLLKICKAPKGLYMPNTLPIKDTKYSVLLSERSSSKTTQCLLYMMVICRLYNAHFVYLRKFKEHTTNQFNKELFKVILMPEYHYIETITDNEFNSIHIDRVSKEVYYCKRNEHGIIEDMAPESFLSIMTVEESERYCSSFNNPKCDHILFDEFSRGLYRPDEIIDFFNIIATIRRERESLRIVMLSNTVSIYNQYLKELGVSKYLTKMSAGAKRVITAELGARVYVEWLDVDIHKTDRFKKVALEYYGFANEKLKAIYGGEFEYRNFPRLPRDINNHIVYRDTYISYMGVYLCIEVMSGDLPCIKIREYTRTPAENKFIFTVIDTECIKPQIILANRLNMRFLLNALSTGRCFFGTNDDGLLLMDFLHNIK